jgi:hypothetical protein
VGSLSRPFHIDGDLPRLRVGAWYFEINATIEIWFLIDRQVESNPEDDLSIGTDEETFVDRTIRSLEGGRFHTCFLLHALPLAGAKAAHPTLAWAVQDPAHFSDLLS